MTEAERRVALEQISSEVRLCTRCRLHEGRTRAVPGEGNPDTEVVFVGEGPGFNEDREGRPFVGRAGALLVKLLASVGWRREDVFITNVVKCRPPDNRDPQPDEIAACAPYLRRQLEVLDPALVVTLGRYSMGTFMPGARISQAHGTVRPVDPATGAADALALAMYHPAAALRSTEVERQSFGDMAAVPRTLLQSREQRADHGRTTTETQVGTAEVVAASTPPPAVAPEPVAISVAAAVKDVPAPVSLEALAFADVNDDPASPALSLAEPAPLPVAILVTGSLSPASDMQPEPGTDQLTLF